MRGRSIAAGSGVLVVMLVVAAAFAVPYRGADRRVGTPVVPYVGDVDGGGVLSRRVDGDTTTWVSTTSQVVPDLDVANMSTAIRDSILGRAGIDSYLGSLPGVDVVTGYEVERPERGDVVTRVVTSVLDEHGWGLVAVAQDGGDPVVFEPPLPVLPADPTAGTSWDEEGTLGGTTYTWSAEIAEVGPRSVELGDFDDCLTVESSLATIAADGSEDRDDYRDVFCRGVGSVESSAESSTGVAESAAVSITGEAAVGAPPLARTTPPEPMPELGADPWEVATVVNQVSGVTTLRPAAIPEPVPVDPPLLVVSAEGTGQLEAVRTTGGEDASARAWRHVVNGTTYGGMLADPDRGRIFAGSTSGTVHAISSEGLFLWATDVGDNVATRPALVAGALVVGSESGEIVGLDPDDGTERWRVDTGAPVTSSPAVLGDLAILGSDDGTVRAVRATDGSVAWEYEIEDRFSAPIEAPVVEVDGDVLVVTRIGQVIRLDGEGNEVWTASTLLPIGTAPAVGDGLAVVALGDFGGDIVALDLATGEEAWRVIGDHVGPVAAIGGRASFVIAEASGALVGLDAEGREVERWEVPAMSGAAAALNRLAVGPVRGAGALWLVDELGRVLRLGPAAPGLSTAQEMAPIWGTTSADRPFEGGSMRASPLVEGDQVHVIDNYGTIFEVDPATGRPERTGALDLGDVTVVLPTPVVDGTAYVTAQAVVAAVSLPAGGTEWEATVPGTVYQPASVGADALVVPSTTRRALHVSVFDRDTGDLRWTERAGALASDGITVGAAVDGGVVYAGDPLTARSLEDGSVLWRSSERGLIGAITVIDGGRTIVTGTGDFDSATGRGAVVAVDAATGERRWRVATPGVPPDPLADLVVDEATSTVVLQGGDGRTLVGIDADAGELRWQRELPTRRLGSGALVDGRGWFPLSDGRVLVLDPADGVTVAHSPDTGIDLSDQSLAQRPVEVDGVVIVSAGLALFGFDAGAGG